MFYTWFFSARKMTKSVATKISFYSCSSLNNAESTCMSVRGETFHYFTTFNGF